MLSGGGILSTGVSSAYVSRAVRDSIAGMGEIPNSSLPIPLPVWKRLLLPAVLAVLAVAALWLDIPIAHYFLAKPWRGDLAKLASLCETFGYGGTVVFILLAAAVLDPRGWRVLTAANLGSVKWLGAAFLIPIQAV